MRFVPETSNRGDWPRLVAATVNAIIRAVTTAQTDINTAEGNITTLQGQVATAQSDITSLQGRVTTAETNITALQAETNWAALADYADDAAAATGGVAVGKLYRTGSQVKVRVS